MSENTEKRIVIFDDDASVIENLQKNLQRLGWVVFAVVCTMAEVDSTIEKMVEQGVNVAIVDGNLVHWSAENTEGRIIVAKLKAHGITSIGNAGQGSVGADIEAGKRNTATRSQLTEILNSIPEKK